MTRRFKVAGVAAFFAFLTLFSACSADSAGAGVADVTPSFGGAVDAAPEPAPSNVGYPPGHPASLMPGQTDPPATDPTLGPVPQVISLVPNEGTAQGGDVVTIEGDRFDPGASVFFGDVAVPQGDVFYIDKRFINVTTPPAGPGLLSVTVTNPDGAAGTLDDAFLAFDDLGVLTVAPAVGDVAGGETIAVTGHGFTSEARVLVGGRLALNVEVESGSTLTAVTPPGKLGLADVRVVLLGQEVAQLRDGYRYVGAPVVEAVWPPHGPTIGGTQVEIAGRYFLPDSQFAFGEKAAEVVSIAPNGRKAVVKAPGGDAGPVSVTCTHAYGQGTLEGAFAYLVPGSALQAWAALPGRGSAAGGYQIAVVVTGLDPALAVSVMVGDTPSPHVTTGLYPDTLFVEVPAGEPGWAPIALGQGVDWVTVPGGFTYTEPFAISGVTPEVGDPAGGDGITLYGAGFVGDEPLAVWLGGTPAPEVAVISDGQAVFEMPPCSPGLVDLVVRRGAREVVLRDAFECVPAQPVLYAVDPPEAAQAGGTWVRLIGAGLPLDSGAEFGGVSALEVQRESQIAVWARVPRGDVGPVDVVVSGAGHALSLTGGLAYFDPANKKRAVWDQGIERTVNVSVFDADSGEGLKDATAILGSDPNTKYQCLTDERGQCTISWHDLKGPQMVTGARSGYSAYTIAGFEGTNVTMFIRKQSPPAQQGPPGSGGGGGGVDVNLLTGTIRGHVTGVGKYVQPPTPSCVLVGSPDGSQCASCDAQTPCPTGLGCQPLDNLGSFCLLPCLSDDQCSDGFSCVLNGTETLCVPTGGKVSARCAISRSSFFGGNPEVGPGAEVNEAGEFELNSRLGEVTVYCVAGYTSPGSGEFVPTRMGIHATVVVYLDSMVEGVTVPLDIPLTRTLAMRIFDLPEHAGGASAPSHRVGLDLGAEGWIPFPETPAYVEGELNYFAGFPESFEPFGPDVALTIYSTVTANASPAPASYRLAYRLTTLNGEAVRTKGVGETRWAEPETGVTGDLSAMWGTAPDDVWAVGPKGRMVHRGALGWTAQPNFTDLDLYALTGEAAEQMVAVGAKGTILQFTGASWVPGVLSEPISWDLRAVHGAWAVGDGGILQYNGSVWSPVSVLHSAGLRGVVSLPSGAVYAVGESGKVLTRQGGQWQSEMVVPTFERLNAVTSDGVRVVAVGDAGTIMWRALGQPDWHVLESGTHRDLNAVLPDGNGGFFAGGAVGTLLRFVPEGGPESVSDESEAGLLQLELTGLWRADGVLWAVGSTALAGGPWMAFPDTLSPTHGGFLTEPLLDWTFLEGGEDPTYNSFYVSSSDGFSAWSVISAGPLNRIALPPLMDVIGYDPMPLGQKYFNLTRARNPDFSMRGYRFNALSMWRRIAWSTTYGTFY